MIFKIAYCAGIKCILNLSQVPFHIYTHTKEIKMPVVIFFLRLWFCFRPYLGKENKITDESLRITIPVVDLIKMGNSSIFSSFANHEKNVIFSLFFLQRPKEHYCIFSPIYCFKKRLWPFFIVLYTFMLSYKEIVQVHFEINLFKRLMFMFEFSGFGVIIFSTIILSFILN